MAAPAAVRPAAENTRCVDPIQRPPIYSGGRVRNEPRGDFRGRFHAVSVLEVASRGAQRWLDSRARARNGCGRAGEKRAGRPPRTAACCLRSISARIARDGRRFASASNDQNIVFLAFSAFLRSASSLRHALYALKWGSHNWRSPSVASKHLKDSAASFRQSVAYCVGTRAVALGATGAAGSSIARERAPVWACSPFALTQTFV